jgi:hypothetical protein
MQTTTLQARHLDLPPLSQQQDIRLQMLGLRAAAQLTRKKPNHQNLDYL